MELKLENVNYIYGQNTNREIKALDNVNLTIGDGEFIGLIGHTGSGKSTLVQHLNGLMKATDGMVLFNGKNIYDDDFKMLDLRSKVGLVFQYPEYQLFEENVLLDVCFGPKNLNCTDDESKERAVRALEQVGIGSETFGKSPFELSGGQKRRVAIAGVLAMEPECIILDEPTAGLDPEGKNKILSEIKELHRIRGITVILVSHSMEDVAECADRLIVMNKGCVKYDDTPRKVFQHYTELENIGLSVPQVTRIMYRLKDEGIDVDTDVITVAEAAEKLNTFIKYRRNNV